MKNNLFFGFLVGVMIALFPIHAKAAQSSDAQELKALQELKVLYEELQGFKDNPNFHQVGFGCCRFKKWMVKVEAIRSKTEERGLKLFYLTVAFPPFYLLDIGMDYLYIGTLGFTKYSQRQEDTEGRIKRMEAEIAAGLAPEPQLKKGQGVVLSTDSVCNSLDIYKKFFAAAQEELRTRNYAESESDAILYGPDCHRVYRKTVVTGPLASKELPWSDGSSSTYHQVQMPGCTRKYHGRLSIFCFADGTKLWFHAGSVKFKSKPSD